MKRYSKFIGLAVVVLMLMSMTIGCSTEKPYPNKAIDLVVPASAGSGGDILTRVIANYLGKEIGVSINVVNTPGGSGIPAVQSVLEAKADGYTLLADQALSSSYQNILKELPYKVEDRTFICRVGKGPQVLSGSVKLGWKDLNDVKAWIEKNPNDFIWGGISNTSAANFAVLQFLNAAKVDISKTKELRYGGGGEIMAAVAGGHILLGSCAASGVPPFAESKKVQPLAVAGSSRLAMLPDVPCAAEQGFPEFKVGFWVGLSGPAKLPEEVVTLLDNAVKKIIKDPKFIEELNKIGVVVDYADGKQMKADVEAEGKEAAFFVSLAAQ
jgi:tripartite-type tricarboxylate transporter receptor subunit TctC